MSISEDIPVEGEITVPVGSRSPDEDYSTLDEPVRDTIVSLCPVYGKTCVLPISLEDCYTKTVFLLDLYFFGTSYVK